MLPAASDADARSVSGASSDTLGPVVRLGRGAFSALSFGDGRRPARAAAADPVGTAGARADSPAGRPLAPRFWSPPCPLASRNPANPAPPREPGRPPPPPPTWPPCRSGTPTPPASTSATPPTGSASIHPRRLRPRPRVPRPHPRPPPTRRLAATVRRHHRRPGGHRGLRPRPVPHPARSRLPRRRHLPPVHPPDPGPAQDRQARLPVDPAAAPARPAAARLPARRGHPDAARLRPPAGQPGAAVGPARPAHAEGAGADEPEADQGAGRRHRRDRPEDHPRHPGRRAEPGRAGQAAGPPVPALRGGHRRRPWTAATGRSTWPSCGAAWRCGRSTRR